MIADLTRQVARAAPEKREAPAAWLEAGVRNRSYHRFPADRPGYPHARCRAKAKRTGARCRLPAIRGERVCRVHGGLGLRAARQALAGKQELPKPPRDPAAAYRRLVRRVKRDQYYAAQRERREQWRQEAQSITGFAQLSAADQELIIRLLASERPEDQTELSKALTHLGLAL